mmetsp:Transcript_13879/g.19510  ORF Transcript_13879/g.19510 Transcript_13879/m.19510 type:complete len:643 (-) Transcript_13879:426-2354(-)
MALAVHRVAEMEQKQPPVALRRAVYVHVSDLTSAYDIDNAKLESELTRVKAARDRASEETPSQEEELGLFDHGNLSGVETEGTLVSIPQKRLQPPRGGYNLCVLVGKVNVVVDKFRVDQSRVRLAEVEIGDETGVVSLRARDNQIEVFQEVSERSGAVVLRNATIELYQGRHIRLAITKWGKLSRYPDQVASTPPPPSKLNRDRNFSLIDLSLVATEMVLPPAPDLSQGRLHSERDEGRGPQSSSRNQQSQSNQQQQNRRGGRDRKQQQQQQPRQNTSGIFQPHTLYQDSAQVARFGPMQGFAPSYAEAVDMPTHFGYPPQEAQQRRNQSAQQAQQILLQQFELQQRQLQHQQHQQMQMYQEQQERQRRMLPQPQQQGRQMQTQSVLLPGVVGSTGSFESTAEYPVSPQIPGNTDQYQSVLPVVGTNPLIIPMQMAASSHMTGRSQAPNASLASSDHSRQETYKMTSQSAFLAPDTKQGEAGDIPDDPRMPEVAVSTSGNPAGSAWGKGPPANVLHHEPRADSPGSPGRMNPQATAFAPSFVQQQPSQRQPAEYTYVAYDPSQASGPIYGSPNQQHPMYAQGVVYVPALHPVEQQQPSAAPGPGESQGRKQQDTTQDNNIEGAVLPSEAEKRTTPEGGSAGK